MRPAPRAALAAAAAAMLLAGCGPSVERAFSKCVDIAVKQNASAGKSLSPELARMLEKNSRGHAEEQCSVIRNECRNDPQSESCQRLIQQYGK